MPKQILIVRSNPIDPDPRVEKMARALAEANHRILILGWDHTCRLPAVEHRSYAVIHRCSISTGFAHGIFNLPGLLRWEVAQLRWLIRHRSEYDIIHACDFDTILPALLIQSVTKKKVVYDIFDFYSEMLRATPEVLKRMIRAMDLWAIGRADALILADDSRRRQISGARPRRLEIIYNTPEDVRDQIASRKPVRPPFSLLHLTYVGLLQIERGLLHLLEVLHRHSEWTLDLAGSGGEADQITRIAAELPNVTWHGTVPYQAGLELSAKADVLLATFDPKIPNNRYSSSNKLFEAMMLGKPIIVAHDTNMDRIVTEVECGLVVNYGDDLALEAALLRLQREPKLRLRLGKNARRAYETNFNWTFMQQRLYRLYGHVTG